MRRRAAENGFTLLELLIVITILGLIVVALTSGVRFAGQAWRVQERRSETEGDLDAVQNVLRQLIMTARDVNGDGFSVRFVSTLPDALGRGGLYDVELRTQADRLVLAWKPHFRGPTAETGWTSTDLVEGVHRMDVAYFVAPGGWQRLAEIRNGPPRLVRIGLETSDARTWPLLTVAPMIEARSGVMK
jgi:prepilin-type N-terminal cleavage/methylation domain-containing protein